MKEQFLAQAPSKMLILGVLFAVILYFANTSKSPWEVKTQTLMKELNESKEKLRITNEKTNNKNKFQEEMVQLSETVNLALQYLPKELEIQDLLKKIYSEARNAGVQLSIFKPKDSVTKDFYDELPMEIAMKGSYSQMVLFLSYVSKLPRIINIKNVEMVDPVLVEGVANLKLNGVLLAYRYKDGK